MDRQTEFALMAAGSYDDVRPELENKAPIPPGWTELQQYRVNGSGPNATSSGSGFSARVYKNDATGEVVISYAGTEFAVKSWGLANDFVDGNIPLAIGNTSRQAIEAARLYQRVKREQGSNITFTGHSLGGGLAAVMAAWFDRPALVFAPAPFELAARRTDTAGLATTGLAPALIAGAVAAGPLGPLIAQQFFKPSAIANARAALAGEPGGIDPAFMSYVPDRDFSQRESAITAWAVKGEVLEATLFLLPWAEAARTNLFAQGATELDMLSKHSIDLHAAGLLSTTFNEWAAKLATALPIIFDRKFYAADALGPNADFTVRLLRNEVGTSTQSANSMLTGFANDLQKIGQSVFGASASGLDKQGQSALVAQAVEWYRWNTSYGTGDSFFQLNGNVLQYTSAFGAAFTGANKAAQYVQPWLDAIALRDQPGYRPHSVYDQWNVASSDADSAATAQDTWQSQIFVGQGGADSFTGGDLSDVFFAGAGNDTLKGGAGNDSLFGGAGDDLLEGGALGDHLYGGAGTDTYRFSGSFGGDWVVDSDGQGRIEVDGIRVTGTGAKKANPDSSTWTTDAWAFTLVSNGAGGHDLILQRDSSLNQIRIRGWVNGQLGITLGDEVAAPQVNNTFNGDFGKKTNPEGSAYEIGADGNYVADGQQAGAHDLITGTAGADSISGLGGDDALLGRAGDDYIDGGTGSDILQGGLGADTLIGGAGHDILYGSSNGSLYYPTRTDYTPPSPTRPVVLGQGFGWVLDSPGPDGDGVQQSYLSDNVSRDQQAGDAGNVIEGGAGNDTVYAGTGNDIVAAGADDDDVYGMGGSDALAGDAGNDRIYGDGPSQYGPEAIVYYAAPQDHGADVIDGGAGNDRLIGQGQDDALYGGIGDDTLYGDDRDNANTPASVHGLDYLDGGDGADKLVGGGRSDELFGGEGADSLWGDAGAVSSDSAGFLQSADHGDDYLDGEGGNDYLQGEGGNDALFGGSENDTMIGDDIESRLPGANHGADYLDGEDGDDQLAGHGGADTLYGGLGADFLDGDGAETDIAGSFHGADYLDGEEGNDDMIGRGGADTLYGGEGDDKLQGDSAISSTAAQYHGDDYLDGEAGNDSLYGQGGADTLVGGDGADYLDGDGHAADIPVANQGNDHLFGDAGADTLVGGAGADLLDGGVDNDLLEGDLSSSQDGHGSDTLDGGDGDDVLYGDGGDDVLIGGAGNDWIAGEDQESASAVSSLSGNDSLDGGEGNDTLVGGNGNDWLDGGSGTDVLVGGSGRDTYVLAFDGGVKEVVESDLDGVFLLGTDTNVTISQKWTGTVVGEGNQYLTFESGTSRIQIKDGFGDGAQVYEFIDGTRWTQAQMLDRITTPLLLSGTTGSDAMRGGGGNDNLTGGGGDDVVIGGAGMDTLSGGTGNDVVDAGAGGGTARGDEGNDTYRFKRGDGQLTIDNMATDWATANDVLKFGAGIAATDVAVNRVGNDLRVTILNSSDTVVVSNYYLRTDAYYRLSQVQFDDGTTWSRITLEGRVSPEGTAGSDYLTGTANADLIHGGLGSDYLYGLAGDDQLFGEADHDTLEGGLGNDLLDGGSGVDRLYGGDGNDTLVSGETMYGGDGNDTYVVNAWPSSTLTISDTSGVDELILPAGVTPQAVSVDVAYSSGSLRNDALSLSLASGSPIQIEGYFGAQAADSIELIRFADGTVWGRADVMSRVPSARLSDANDQSIIGYVWNDSLDALGGNDSVYGRQGDDTLFGGAGQDSLYGDQGSDSVSGGAGDDSLFGDSEQYTSTGDGNDQIAGGDGNDSLYGAGGRDTLDGGAGADYVLGGDGDDVYLLSRTSGNDGLYDSAGTDRIVFGSDVAPSSVTLWRDGVDLVIAVDQNVLQTRFLSHFSSSANTLDSIQYSDGTIWDAAGIAARTTSGTANAMTGTAGNDLFVVDNAGDTINETLGGTDTVQSSVSWTLGANLENLTLTGFLNLRGTGNGLNNVVTGNSGNNTLDGLAGLDTLIGGAGDDTYNVVPSEDTIVESVGGGTDTVLVATSYALPDNVEILKVNPYLYEVVYATGNALDNIISINSSQTTGNVIDGGAGADTMIADTSYYGATFYVDNVGDKVITKGGQVVSAANWAMPRGVSVLKLTGAAKDGVGNEANNVIIGTGQNGVLQGLGGDDTLLSDTGYLSQVPGTSWTTSWNGIGVDTLVGGTGNDAYYIYSTADTTDVVVEAAGEGNDTLHINTSVGRTYNASEFANVENFRLSGNTDASLAGDGSNNQLYGNRGNNGLVGGAGDDLLVDRGDSGALGTYEFDSDTLDGGDGNDQLTSTYGIDVLDGGAGNDALSVGSNTSTATILFGRGDGADTATLLAGGIRQFVLDSGITISDLQVTRNQRDIVLGFGQGDSITVKNYFADATSVVPSGLITNLQFADGVVLTEQVLVNRLIAGNSNLPTEVADLIIGSAGPDAFEGLGGDDWILGAGGADSLLGGAGADTLTAGDGDDTLAGGAAADLLQGGAGSDTYRFANGDGFDTVEDSAGVDVVEFASGIAPSAVTVTRSGDDLQMLLVGGTDRVTLKGFFASASSEIESVRFADGTIWTLAMLKDMGTQFVGTAGPDSLSGSGADERLSGLAGNDTLNGAAGNDSLDGGDGDDSLIGGAGLDTLTGGAGNDAIDPGTEFDIIRFGRGYGNDRITGLNATGDEIQFDTGVAPTDLKFSYSGANLVIGINGTTDALTVEQFVNYWNQVTLRFTDGTTWTTAQVWDALTTFTGTEAADIINGTANGDRIYANGGNDTVDGLGGNDLIEGGAGDDSLTGGAGYDTLDGGLGIDRMTGGTEDDYYVVDNTSDVVVELSGGGNDSVESSVTYTLATNVENLWLTGAANITGTGNTLNNVLSGNAGNTTLVGGSGDDDLSDYDGGNDSLNGGTGGDYMEAGIGDDTYVVDSALDQVYEYAGEGNDLVQSSINYVLPDDVERLTLTGTSGLTGTGNILDNVLTGNSGANRLDGGDGNDTIDGGTGNDTMIGGAGNDVYYVNVATDVVTEALNAGTDTVNSSVTLTLSSNVENLTLTGSTAINGTGNTLANTLIGNSGANSLSGGDGNDTIDGGAGNDTMVGGIGDDTFYVNVSTDVVTEAASGGIDTVISSVTLTTLAANVDNLTLTGSTNLNGTGNTLANTLIGNSGANSLSGGDGNDTIDGGLGTDTLVGGLGNDTFYVDVSTDVVTEAASAGTDAVMSAITYTLGTNLENLTLTGSGTINGTGNTVANALTGNSATNTLTGNAGADTLDGGAGNDSLVGGTEADVYRFGAGYGIDTISENDATANIKDAVQFVGTVTQANVQFKQVGNNLEVLLTGTSDKLVMQNWYLGTQYQVEEFRFTDGTILTNSQAQGKVTAGAVATSMSVSALAEPAAGIASATGSKQIHMWRQPLAESSAFGAPAAAAMLGGVLALVNRAVDSEVPALEASVGDAARIANLPQWVQTMRRAWAPIASGTASATRASGVLLGLMAKVNPADAAGADALVGLNPMVNSAMPAARLLGLPVLSASVAAVTGGSAAVLVPMASAMPAISPVAAPLQALAPEFGLPVQSSAAKPASQANGRKSIPSSQGVHLDALDPLGPGLDWLGALMQRRMQDLPDVMGLQLHDAAADQPQWVRQASALVDAMAQFNAPAATAVGHSAAGSHVMLDKVTMPGLSV